MGSMGMLVAREPDFMIHGVLKYELFGQEFWLTTTTVSMTIVSLLILALAFAANRTMKKATDVPGMFQNILELATEMLDKMAVGILNGNAHKFANYIGTIFAFILLNNLSGLLGLRITALPSCWEWLPFSLSSIRVSKTGGFATLPVCLNRHRYYFRLT